MSLQVNLDKLVRDILLDVGLLRWFALNRMTNEVLRSIELARAGQATDDEQAVLAFLAAHCRLPEMN